MHKQGGSHVEKDGKRKKLSPRDRIALLTPAAPAAERVADPEDLSKVESGAEQETASVKAAATVTKKANTRGK